MGCGGSDAEVKDVEMHDEIFHFEIFKNFMKFLNISRPFSKYFIKLLIFNIKWLKTLKNVIKVYQVSRRYIMLFMHNNKYLPLTGLLTLLQWTIHNTACIVLHPAKYFDIRFYGVKWLKQANNASIGLQIGLGSCSMHKWMKGNVWRIKNVKRVSVKPEKYIVKFLKYFRNISWNI